MFRFTIRDVLWLTVVVALAVSWWIDNKRIEKAVTKAESEQRLLRADFEDKMTVLDEMAKKAPPSHSGMVDLLSKINLPPEAPEKSKSPQD